MRVLIACEFSGIVREEFLKKGHDTWSCDLLPSEIKGPHIQDDVLKIINQGWDLMIAHPPCTYLSVSGIHWNKRIPGRQEKTDEALEFVKKLLNAPIEKIALENPVSIISTHIRKPDQIIQPYCFGIPESKQTCLWLKNLPLLKPTNILTANSFQKNGKPRWNNMTPTGQNKLGPSEDRWKIRSRTYPEIAEAFASQWG